MSGHERLADEAAIQRLIAVYARLLDWLEWDRLDDVFWPDARFDFGMFRGDLAAYRDFVATLEEGYRRRLHMFGLPLLDFADASTRARVEVTSLIVCRTEVGSEAHDDRFCGRYLFDAERRGDTWKLARLTYLLNMLERPAAVDDSALPLNRGNDLGPTHALARGSL